MAGVRIEATRADYAANELIFANGAFTGRTIPATGLDRLRRRAAGRSPQFLSALEAHDACRVDQHARASRLRGPGAHQHSRRGPGNRRLATSAACRPATPSSKPYESMNLDVSFEYYLPRACSSIAPFYKRIDNPIYDRSVTEAERRPQRPHLRALRTVRPENADRGHIGGVEFNYQTVFSSAALAVRWARHELQLHVDRFVRHRLRPRATTCRSSSSRITSATPRCCIARRHRSAGVGLVPGPIAGFGGCNGDADNFSDWYTPLDAKVSLPIGRILRGFVETRNLNDEPRDPLRLDAGSARTAHEIYSRDFYAGIDWRF